MSVHVPAAAFTNAAPAVFRPNRVQRPFDLHPAIFGMLFAAFAAFLAILGAAFMTKELWLPFAIFGVYLVMAFATPALWSRIAGTAKGPRQSWAEFMIEGVETGTGHLPANAALWQIFTVPVLLVGWATAVAVIAALV
jgi:hypothetical protein